MKFSNISVLGVLVAAALSAGAYSLIPNRAEQPVFVDGQFTATLDQKSRHWRLLPIDGQDVELFSPGRQCGNEAPIPPGIWLVTPTAADGPNCSRLPSPDCRRDTPSACNCAPAAKQAMVALRSSFRRS